MGAYSYSGTAASNTSLDGIGAAGSSSPANLDDLHRAQGAALANFVRDLGGATAGGTANALTLALNDATTLPAYFDGMVVGMVASLDNDSTTVTINVDSVGAKAIKKAVAGVETAPAIGDIQAGGYYLLRYRSAWASAAGAFQIVNMNDDFLTAVAAAAAYQPLDSDLTAIAALTTTAAARSILTLADPNADRIAFWDDSAGSYAHLTLGTGLSITGTTIDASASWTLLGTLTTTSGASQALSPLVLTSYKFLKVVFNGVSHSDGSQRAITMDGVKIIEDEPNGTAIYGHVIVDLSNGIAAAITGGNGSSGSTWVADTTVTTADISITFAPEAGNFDAGSIKVYAI